MTVTHECFVANVGSAEIVLPNGTRASMRAMTAHDERMLRRPGVLPEPEPPLRKKPGGGSLAREPDFNDAGYLAEQEIWHERYCIAFIAAGIDLKLPNNGGWNPDIEPAAMKAWCDEAYDLIARHCTGKWLKDARLIVNRLSLGHAIEEAGLGNSGTSAPSGNGGPGSEPRPSESGSDGSSSIPSDACPAAASSS